MRRLWPFETLARDVLHGFRQARRHAVYSLVVIGVLAVGIAANLIAFGLLKAVALAPLAGVAGSGSLLFVGSRTGSGQVIPLSYPDYTDLRDQGLPGLAGWALQPLILAQHGAARLVQTELVTGNYFDVLGVRVRAGRAVAAGDTAVPGGQPVVVISDGLWRRAFGSDPAVIGTTIRVNGYPLTVIGIADSRFKGGVVGIATDLFVPITMQGVLTGRDALAVRGDRWVHAFMRQPADGPAAAAGSAARAGRMVAATFPIETIPERAVVVPIWRWPYGAQSYMLPAVGLLGAMSLLLLVVVSANVAGLVLVRSLSRRGETAARLTLGATRGRVIRQLVIESLALALPAAAIGFALPALLEPFLGAAAANVSLPLFFNTAPDRLVVAVTVALAVMSALIYGVGPALSLSRVDLSTVLKDDRSGGSSTSRLRSALVVVQIAVTVVLLVGTALVLRSLTAAQQADAGFDPRHVAWATFDARSGGYDESRGRQMYARLLDAIRADPGVTDASLAAYLPLTLIDWMSWDVRPGGYQPARDESMAFAVNIVTPGYFRTLRIPIVAGREFEPVDERSDELRVVVNDTFARRFWSDPMAAVGRSVAIGERRGTIVGVARDIKYARLDEASRPYLYVPSAQFYSPSMTLQVRGGDPAAVLANVRRQARAVDPAMTVLQSGEMSDTLRSATSLYETLARMLTLVGVLAIAVAVLGVYGLIAYTVAQKQQEIGVRTALGATSSRIVWQFLGHGARLAVAGIGLGAIAALGVSRLMTSVLFGVTATDLASFVFGAAMVLVAALLASLAPAWRAATTDPLRALRQL